MNRLAKIAKPTIGIVTNIGVSHIGQLGSRENIRREKLSIVNEFGHHNGGSLYVNGNDDLLRVLREYQQETHTSGEIVLNKETLDALHYVSIYNYGTTEACSYKSSNIQYVNGTTSFIYEANGEREAITLSVLGDHNVMNAVAALAIAKELGIEPRVAKVGLYTYQPIAMRGQIETVKGITIIDDSYNASPDSMKSGLNVLLAIEGAKRTMAVLADVLELGEVSYQCHYEVGEYITELAKKGN